MKLMEEPDENPELERVIVIENCLRLTKEEKPLLVCPIQRMAQVLPGHPRSLEQHLARRCGSRARRAISGGRPECLARIGIVTGVQLGGSLPDKRLALPYTVRKRFRHTSEVGVLGRRAGRSPANQIEVISTGRLQITSWWPAAVGTVVPYGLQCSQASIGVVGIH